MEKDEVENNARLSDRAKKTPKTPGKGDDNSTIIENNPVKKRKRWHHSSSTLQVVVQSVVSDQRVPDVPVLAGTECVLVPLRSTAAKCHPVLLDSSFAFSQPLLIYFPNTSFAFSAHKQQLVC